MQIDHVIIAVSDLDVAAQRFRDRFGLNAIGGGTHPMGTRNISIPLRPPQYLELLTVGDKDIAKLNPFGRLMIERISSNDSLLSWAVRAEDIEAQAARLNRPLFPGEFHAPDGTVGRWQNVFADLSEFDQLPFFIRYEGDDSSRRQAAYAEASSRAEPGGITWLEVGGEHQRMIDWLGTESLPIRFAGGVPGLRAVAVQSPGGEIVIRNEDL